jgi:hypothetical protein
MPRGRNPISGATIVSGAGGPVQPTEGPLGKGEMPLWVGIRAAPMEDGDSCPVFNPAVWWQPDHFWRDAPFRGIDPVFYYSIACLDLKEIRDLQVRFHRFAEITDNWKRESDRLDAFLDDPRMSGAGG